MDQYGFRQFLLPLFFLAKNNAIVAFFSYALTISLANALGPGQFGLYSQALIVASLLSILINFGTDQTAPVVYSKIRDKRALVAQVIGVRAVFVSLCFFGLLLNLFIAAELSYYIFCLIIANLNLAFLYEIACRNERYSYIYLVERLLYLGLAFFSIWFQFANLPVIFASLMFSTLASIFFQYLDCREDVGLTIGDFGSSFRSVIVSNTPLIIISLSLFSYGGFARIILENKLGSEVLGIYSAGWQLITIGTIFQAQVSRVWRLKVSEAVHARDAKMLIGVVQSYSLFALLPMLAISLFLIFASEAIVDVLFAENYRRLNDVIPVFGVYVIIIGLAGLIEMLWVALSRNVYYMVVHVLFGLALVLFLNLLPNDYGMVGFAAVTIAVHTVSTIVLGLVWFFLFRMAIRQSR